MASFWHDIATVWVDSCPHELGFLFLADFFSLCGGTSGKVKDPRMEALSGSRSPAGGSVKIPDDYRSRSAKGMHGFCFTIASSLIRSFMALYFFIL